MVSSNDIYSSKGLELISEIEYVRTALQITDFWKIFIDSLTAKIPSSLKFIIGQPACQIINEHFESHFYSSSTFSEYHSLLRRVYLSGNAECANSTEKWQIIPLDNGKSFLIRNAAYEEYLVAWREMDYFIKDKKGRKVFTYRRQRPVNEAEWFIDVTIDGKLKFRNAEY